MLTHFSPAAARDDNSDDEGPPPLMDKPYESDSDDSDNEDERPPPLKRFDPNADDSDDESDDDDDAPAICRRGSKRRILPTKKQPNYYEEGQEDNASDADVVLNDDAEDSDLELEDHQLNNVARGQYVTPTAARASTVARKPTPEEYANLESNLDGNLSMLTYVTFDNSVYLFFPTWLAHVPLDFCIASQIKASQAPEK